MTQIQLRHDTAANWTSANPTLTAGELGVETDTQKFKIGDGSTAWADLSYANGETIDAYTKTETDTLLEAKQDTLSTSQLAAVNSGITTDTVNLVGTLDVEMASAQTDIANLETNLSTLQSTVDSKANITDLDNYVSLTNTQNIFYKTLASTDTSLQQDIIIPEICTALSSGKAPNIFIAPDSYVSNAKNMYFVYNDNINLTYSFNNYIYPVVKSFTINDTETNCLELPASYQTNGSYKSPGFAFYGYSTYGYSLEYYVPSTSTKAEVALLGNTSGAYALLLYSSSTWKLNINGTVTDISDKYSDSRYWAGAVINITLLTTNKVSSTVSDTDTLTISINGTEVASYTGSDIPEVFQPGGALFGTYITPCCLNCDTINNYTSLSTPLYLTANSIYYTNSTHSSSTKILYRVA